MSKYLKRALICLVIGILLCCYGLYSKDPVASFYKLPLVLGVLFFGVGFVLFFYSLIRKIERKSLLEQRAESTNNERGGE